MKPAPESQEGSPCPSARNVPGWHAFALLLGGAALVLFGAWVGERGDVGRALLLDVKGATAPGVLDRVSEGTWRLSYVLPGGERYARTGPAPTMFPPAAEGPAEVVVKYDPEHPRRFQMAGKSFAPGALALLLFVAGMTLVLRARRTMMRGRIGAIRQVKKEESQS